VTTRSAADEREAARLAYDAFLAACPTRQLYAAIANKWNGLVLSMLMASDAPRRFAEIQRTVAGVSPKVLTQVLRSLERDGLVTRTVTAQVPVRVDYALTPLGRDLAPLMRVIKDWAEAHMPEIAAARERYDRGLIVA